MIYCRFFYFLTCTLALKGTLIGFKTPEFLNTLILIQKYPIYNVFMANWSHEYLAGDLAWKFFPWVQKKTHLNKPWVNILRTFSNHSGFTMHHYIGKSVWFRKQCNKGTLKGNLCHIPVIGINKKDIDWSFSVQISPTREQNIDLNGRNKNWCLQETK